MQYTTNYGFPLFEAGDNVDLMASYNVAMNSLDTIIHSLATGADLSTLAARVTAVEGVASSAQSTATTANGKATALETALTKTATEITVDELADAIVTTGGYIALPDSNNNQ